MQPCFLPSLLLIPQPWASVCIPSCMQSLHLFIFLHSLVTMWAQCERCVCLSPLAIFRPSHRDGNGRRAPANHRKRMRRAQSHTDRYTYECAFTGARRQIVMYLRFNQIQEARIKLFCARYCYKHALNLGKVPLYTSFWCFYVPSCAVV